MKMRLRLMSVSLLLGVLSIFILSSCVDMPTKAVTPPTPYCYYRFLHVAEGVGSVSVILDKQPFGTLDYKGVTPYAEYLAGKKQLIFSTGDTLIMSMSTDYRGTMCIIKEGGKLSFVRANELRVFDPLTGEKGKLRFVHLSPDAPEVDIKATGPEELQWTGLKYKGIGRYLAATPGQYAVTVTPKGGTTPALTFDVTVGNEPSTVYIIGSVAGGTLSALTLKDK